jgi:hypothetical protein
VNVIKNNDEPLNCAENEMINVSNCLFFQFFSFVCSRSLEKKLKDEKSHCASMNDYYCDFLVSNQGWLEVEEREGERERLIAGEGERKEIITKEEFKLLSLTQDTRRKFSCFFSSLH